MSTLVTAIFYTVNQSSTSDYYIIYWQYSNCDVHHLQKWKTYSSHL